MWNFHDVITAGFMRIDKTWGKARSFYERNEAVGEELYKCLFYYFVERKNMQEKK